METSGIDASLARLGTDYVDLYLIHRPFQDFSNPDAPMNKRTETWKAMERILALGKAKSIGVSNYAIDHLTEMKTYAHVMPTVNQAQTTWLHSTTSMKGRVCSSNEQRTDQPWFAFRIASLHCTACLPRSVLQEAALRTLLFDEVETEIGLLEELRSID